jgi:hypothetical protein
MIHLRRALWLSLLIVSSAQATVPARYVVFEIDRHDAVTLVSAEDVDVAAIAESTVDASAASDDPDRVDVEVRDADGAVVHRTSLHVDRYLRGEFASSDGTIDGKWIERDRTAFAVRLPAIGETIEIRSPRSRTTSQFSVRALPVTIRSAAFDRIRGDAGNPANRLDLLVMGDGYTAAEAGKFDADVQRITSQFFSIVPYSAYRSFVNVTSYFVASAQSGADHPQCADGPDPKAGTIVDTAFDATYCSAGIQRLVTVNESKVYKAAAAVPNWDMIMIVVNDSIYGGAGGAVSVVSTHAQAVGVAQHEFGHSFTGLADEYSTPYPGYPSCSDVSGNRVCEPNVTDQTSRASIKWNSWIDASTTIPTPPALSSVGLFLGARYQSTGFYRPKNECLMNTLGRPFCEVCAQEYVRHLYSGWNGVPRNGVDLIESVSPAGAQVQATAGETLTLTASILNPDGGNARIRWLVDGVEIAGATSSAFAFAPTAGTHAVELRVSDPTTLVNAAMVGSALTKKRTWSVIATARVAAKKRRAIRP